MGELYETWDQRVREEQRRKAERIADERVQWEEHKARVRQYHLRDLAQRTTAAWRELESLVQARNSKSYDRAVALLVDLRDAATLVGKKGDFETRLQTLRKRHARKSALIRRVETSGL